MDEIIKYLSSIISRANDAKTLLEANPDKWAAQLPVDKECLLYEVREADDDVDGITTFLEEN